MIRYRRNRAGIGCFPVPLTLIDLAWLVTVTTLLSAQFGIVSVRLPQLAGTAATSMATESARGIDVLIATDGGLQLQGQSVAIDDLGPMVKAMGTPELPLMITIATLENGTGHTDRLVQVIDQFQRAHVENPLKVRATASSQEISSETQKGETSP